MVKRILVVGAILAAAILPAAQPTVATTYPWGDLNCSGAVTSVEISAIVNIAAGAPDPWPWCPMPADLNCNGAISALDISIMINIAAGGSYTPPVPCTK